MIPAKFNKLLSALTQLTDLQTKRVEQALKSENPAQIIINALEQRMVVNPECPHCHSDRIKRNGKLNMMQRYRCHACSKTFNATTKTPLAKLHYKDKWLTYFSCMIEGDVLRKSALKCSINLKTSFRWRHRLLELPALLKATSLQGIVEMDETFFPYSEKGSKCLSRPAKKRGEKAKKRGRSKQDWVAVMTARDRSKHTYEAVLSSVSSAELNRNLSGKIEKDSVLCSDGFRAYIQVAAVNKMEHKQLNVSAGIRVIDNVFHIQNVNAYHQRLKSWIKRFHGVATKYLEHYLGWFRFLDTTDNPNENSLFEVQQHLTGT